MLKEIRMTSKTKQMIALMEALNAVNAVDKAPQSLNESTETANLEEMNRDDKAAIVRDLYKGFKGDVNDKAEIETYLRGTVAAVAREEGISAFLLKMAVKGAINGLGPEELYGDVSEELSEGESLGILKPRKMSTPDLEKFIAKKFGRQIKDLQALYDKIGGMYEKAGATTSDQRHSLRYKKSQDGHQIRHFEDKYNTAAQKLRKKIKSVIDHTADVTPNGSRDYRDESDIISSAIPHERSPRVDEVFGMPAKRSDRQTDTMYNLAMDYKDKFGFETFPVGEHMKEWLASVAGEMKSDGITPAQMRVYLTAAYTFAKGGYQPKSESAINDSELSEEEGMIDRILRKGFEDGSLTVDDEGTYRSTMEPVLDPETKKAMAASIARTAKPGVHSPKRLQRALDNLSHDEVNEAKKPTTPEETKAHILKKYAGEIKKVKKLYQDYKAAAAAAAGPNMTRDGKTSSFKDATKSATEWTAYTTAGKKLHQKINDYLRRKELPTDGDTFGAFTDLQNLLQK